MTPPSSQGGKRSRFIASVLAGTLVAGAGWTLSERVGEQAAQRFETVETARLQLGQTMLTRAIENVEREARQLAELPLLSEFIDLATTQPVSVDAQELAAYLQDVLAASMKETGDGSVLAVSPDGKVLLKAPLETSDQVPPHPNEEGVFLHRLSDGSSELWWRQPVPAYQEPDKSGGSLYLRFAAQDLAHFERAGLVLEISGNKANVTEVSEQSSAGSATAKPAGQDPRLVAANGSPALDILPLRVFAILAGFAVFAASVWAGRFAGQGRQT